jgi:hypothetical protein
VRNSNTRIIVASGCKSKELRVKLCYQRRWDTTVFRQVSWTAEENRIIVLTASQLNFRCELYQINRVTASSCWIVWSCVTRIIVLVKVAELCVFARSTRIIVSPLQARKGIVCDEYTRIIVLPLQVSWIVCEGHLWINRVIAKSKELVWSGTRGLFLQLSLAFMVPTPLYSDAQNEQCKWSPCIWKDPLRIIVKVVVATKSWIINFVSFRPNAHLA